MHYTTPLCKGHNGKVQGTPPPSLCMKILGFESTMVEMTMFEPAFGENEGKFYGNDTMAFNFPHEFQASHQEVQNSLSLLLVDSHRIHQASNVPSSPARTTTPLQDLPPHDQHLRDPGGIHDPLSFLGGQAFSRNQQKGCCVTEG